MGKAKPETYRKNSRLYWERHREAARAKKREHYRKNKERELLRYANRRKTLKGKAGAKLRYAVWIGKIKKPELCSQCNRKDKLHGHHKDYSRPFEVKWLCSICHGKAHRKR
ncbi:MAG TPA: hypothetical protein ENI23_06420 [bacterium]|nr:hypothetical protein [bacterium]